MSSPINIINIGMTPLISLVSDDDDDDEDDRMN